MKKQTSTGTMLQKISGIVSLLMSMTILTGCASIPRMGADKRAPETDLVYYVLDPHVQLLKYDEAELRMFVNPKIYYQFLGNPGEHTFYVRALYTKNTVLYSSDSKKVTLTSAADSVVLVCADIKEKNYKYSAGDNAVVEFTPRPLSLPGTRKSEFVQKNKVVPEAFQKACYTDAKP